jgi:chromosome segregation ATPase
MISPVDLEGLVKNLQKRMAELTIAVEEKQRQWSASRKENEELRTQIDQLRRSNLTLERSLAFCEECMNQNLGVELWLEKLNEIKNGAHFEPARPSSKDPIEKLVDDL